MCWLTGAYSLWVHCLPLEDRLLGCRKFSSIPVISSLLYGAEKGSRKGGFRADWKVGVTVSGEPICWRSGVFSLSVFCAALHGFH